MTGWPSAWTDPAGGHLIPAGRRAAGRLAPPPSKSLTHRALNLALLAGQELIVEGPLEAEDTLLFRAALETLGWTCHPEAEPSAPPRHPEAEPAPAGAAEGSRRSPSPAAAAAPAWRLVPGPRPERAEIHCGNAGTMFRFLVAALAATPGTWRLDGVPRLRERPVGPLADALAALGAEIEWQGAPGHAPLVVHGRRLAGGRVRLDAGESSQYLSALLMAATTAAGPVEIDVPRLTSAPYVDLTLDLLARFEGRVEPTADGFRVEPGPLASPGRLRIEPDLSAACYPAAAAALTGGTVVLEGVDPASRQGDRAFLDLLAEMGAEVRWRGSGAAGEVEVRGAAPLRALDADLSSLPDQVTTLAALAPFARGTTRIRNVAHLRIKESDRLAAMARELARLGVPIEEHPDALVVPGVWADAPPPEPPSPIPVDSHDDHRVAMSLALTGLRRPGTLITRPEVVAKSYPGFWRDFAALLGE